MAKTDKPTKKTGLTELKVVTFNANRNDMTKERLRMLVEHIESLRGDIYGFQEFRTENVPLLEKMFDTEYEIRTSNVFEDMGHHVIMVRKNALKLVPDSEYCMIMGTKHGAPDKHLEAITLRATQSLMVQKHHGSLSTRLLIAVTQLDNMGYKAWEEGNKQVLKYLKNNWEPRLPTVYMGDFNINTAGYASTEQIQKPLRKIKETGFYGAWEQANGSKPQPRTFFQCRRNKS